MGSNHRPPACRADALPAELSDHERDRGDLNSPYHLDRVACLPLTLRPHGSPTWTRTKINRLTAGRSALELRRNELPRLAVLSALARGQPS